MRKKIGKARSIEEEMRRTERERERDRKCVCVCVCPCCFFRGFAARTNV